LQQLIDVYEKYDAPVIGTMQVKAKRSRVSVCSTLKKLRRASNKVRDMVESPPLPLLLQDLAIIGRYVLTPDIFAEIEQTKPGAGGRDSNH